MDLVEGRDAERLSRWLRDHPGVQVISRDRGGAYADGATAGAPDALQAADCFHLLQNATSALGGTLRGRRLALVETQTPAQEPALPAEFVADGEPEPRETPSEVVPERPLSPTGRY